MVQEVETPSLLAHRTQPPPSVAPPVTVLAEGSACTDDIGCSHDDMHCVAARLHVATDVFSRHSTVASEALPIAPTAVRVEEKLDVEEGSARTNDAAAVA